MQDKTISIIKLAEAKGKKPFRPSAFISTLSAPIDRYFIKAIEEASGNDNFPAVCISLAAFKNDTKGAGGKDDIDSFGGVFIDLDSDKGTRPDEVIPIGELTKYVEDTFPNTAGMIYQSYNGKGAHVYLMYDEQCGDYEVNADAATMVRDKFFQSDYKEFLDDGAFTPERKIYIRKGTEPRILLGEGLDATKRYYDTAEARDAVESNIKAYFKQKKAPAKKETAKPADEFTPHDKNLLSLLRDMNFNGLIGNTTKADKWINIDAGKWVNATSQPQWSIPKDCKQVNKFGKANTKEFNSIKEFVSKVIDDFNTLRLNIGSTKLNAASTNKLLADAAKIDEAANPIAKTKTDKNKKTEAGAFMKSNEAMTRDIIIANFKNVLDKAGAMIYRVESTGTYKNTYYCIQDKGYSNVIYGGGKGGKMRFIDIFGSAEWDRMVENIKIDLLVMKEYENDRDVANTAAANKIINKDNITADGCGKC